MRWNRPDVEAVRRPIAEARRAVVAGHFGELAQGRIGPEGPLALVTLATADPAFAAAARWRPAPGAPLLADGSGLAPLAARALRGRLRASGALGWGGRLAIETAAPLGGGCGASTASLLAASRCVGAATPAAEARLCLDIEGAVDPLALAEPGAWLWASREARALAPLGPPPRFLVAGGFDGPAERTDPADFDFPDIADLIAPLRAAFQAGDRAAAAALAFESARRNQARRPKPRFEAVAALAREAGALGVVAAHTGPALGLLFRPDQTAAAGRAADALRALGLARVLSFPAGRAGAGPAPRTCPSPLAARS